MKYFRMSYEEVVYNRSYINIMLLNRSIPSFSTKDENEKEYGVAKSKKKDKKTYKKIDKSIHANDFFMDMM